jgi:K+-sensing histidine kinase KdpD
MMSRRVLDNAVRHAPSDSTVEIVVDGRDTPTVRVLDQGPGFDAEFAPEGPAHQLFSPPQADPLSCDGCSVR